MITLKPHRYANVQRKPGDRYEAKPGQELRLVRALGWAADAPVVVAPPAPAVTEPPKRTYTRRAIEAEPVAPAVTEPTAEAAPAEVKPKRTYIRRDLSAEE